MNRLNGRLANSGTPPLQHLLTPQQHGGGSGSGGSDPDCQDFEPSCLVRTPSGNVYIPTGTLNHSKNAGGIPTDYHHAPLHGNSICDSPTSKDSMMKTSPVLPYGTSAVPVLPVRNNLRRPDSGHHFVGPGGANAGAAGVAAASRFHFRKGFASRCSWRCTAIVFVMVTVMLTAALSYITASSLLNWSYQSSKACTVLVGENTELLPPSKVTTSLETNLSSSSKPRPSSSASAASASVSSSTSAASGGGNYHHYDSYNNRRRRDVLPENVVNVFVNSPPIVHVLTAAGTTSTDVSGSTQRFSDVLDVVDNNSEHAFSDRSLHELVDVDSATSFTTSIALESTTLGVETTTFTEDITTSLPNVVKENETYFDIETITTNSSNELVNLIESADNATDYPTKSPTTVTSILNLMGQESIQNTRPPFLIKIDDYEDYEEEHSIKDNPNFAANIDQLLPAVYDDSDQVQHDVPMNSYEHDEVEIIKIRQDPLSTTAKSRIQYNTLDKREGGIKENSHNPPKRIINRGDIKFDASKELTNHNLAAEEFDYDDDLKRLHFNDAASPTLHETNNVKEQVLAEDERKIEVKLLDVPPIVSSPTIAKRVLVNVTITTDADNIGSNNVYVLSVAIPTDIESNQLPSATLNSESHPFTASPNPNPTAAKSDYVELDSDEQHEWSGQCQCSCPCMDSGFRIQDDNMSLADLFNSSTASYDEFIAWKGQHSAESVTSEPNVNSSLSSAVTTDDYVSPATRCPEVTTKLPPPPTILILEGGRTFPAQSFPPDGTTFVQVALGQRLSREIPPYGYWNMQFYQSEAAYVRFDFDIPRGASIGVYARRNALPTHTQYHILEVLSGFKVSRPTRASHSSVKKEVTHYMEQGHWFLSLYNDDGDPQEVSFIAAVADDMTHNCPNGCSGKGECLMGHCQCNPGFGGDDCSDRII